MKPSNVIELDRARASEKAGDAAKGRAAPPGLTRRRFARRIIAVGGGKGGIGKTLVSANLAVALAQRGRRVVAVDADLGGSNLHTCLGISRPQFTLSDFVSRRVPRLEDVQVPTAVDKLFLIAGALDALDAANLKYQQKLKLLRSLQGLDFDYVVLDLGAGTTFNILDFFLIADHGILVLSPEPTSIENAYRFVKAAFFRRLQDVQDRYGIAHDESIKTPFDLLTRVRAHNPSLAEQLERELERFRVQVVVNQTRSAADQAIGVSVAAAWQKFFGLGMDYLGSIGYDDEAWKAVRKRRPLLLERPDCEASRALLKVAENLLALEGRPSNVP